MIHSAAARLMTQPGPSMRSVRTRPARKTAYSPTSEPQAPATAVTAAATTIAPHRRGMVEETIIGGDPPVALAGFSAVSGGRPGRPTTG